MARIQVELLEADTEQKQQSENQAEYHQPKLLPFDRQGIEPSL
ncbi:hypothetical protein [Mucilaginibacter sp. 3215]